MLRRSVVRNILLRMVVIANKRRRRWLRLPVYQIREKASHESVSNLLFLRLLLNGGSLLGSGLFVLLAEELVGDEG